ncbi:MAG: hypothetical protein WCJ39_01565, partial [bacterium]
MGAIALMELIFGNFHPGGNSAPGSKLSSSFVRDVRACLGNPGAPINIPLQKNHQYIIILLFYLLLSLHASG